MSDNVDSRNNINKAINYGWYGVIGINGFVGAINLYAAAVGQFDYNQTIINQFEEMVGLLPNTTFPIGLTAILSLCLAQLPESIKEYSLNNTDSESTLPKRSTLDCILASSGATAASYLFLDISNQVGQQIATYLN